jgi:hypothetical protein
LGVEAQNTTRVRLAYEIELNRVPKAIAERLAETLSSSVDLDAYEIYDPAVDKYITLTEWFEGFYIIATATSEDRREVYVVAGLDIPEWTNTELALYVFTPE